MELTVLGGSGVLAYTGDTGPSPEVPRLARGADLFLSEATHPEAVPAENAGHLLSSRLAGRSASPYPDGSRASAPRAVDT